MTLAEFLHARIAEDEEVARAASPPPWERIGAPHLDPHTIFGRAGTRPDALTHVASVELGWRRDEDSAHITRWDPARVLAECAAKREMLRLHQHWANAARQDPNPVTASVAAVMTDALVLTALAYRHHPDYRTTWPESAAP